MAPAPVTLVARGGNAPAFAWIGPFDASRQASIEIQAQALEFTCAHLRYMGYPEVQEACQRLAAALVSQFGREELSRASFTALPNGGFVVLGLLASILGLSKPQLGAFGKTDSLLVVVDDCAISGARFHEFLDSCQSPRLVFAPLVSPPALRVAIRAAEDRVIDCLSGEDLREAPVPVSEKHQARRKARVARGGCYWIGSTEPLCFPWNEADRTLWNPVLERYERAWRIIPQELCLKNRAPGSRPIPVQVQPAAPGPLRPARSVLFAEIEGEIVLCCREAGQVLRLGETGSVLWRSLVQEGTLDAATKAVTREFDAPESVLCADARRFVEDLLARGLLVDTEE